MTEKQGQIAHLDQNPANSSEDNLAFLCLTHHSLYDSQTNQHKNFTLGEVRASRAELYEALGAPRKSSEAKGLQSSAGAGQIRRLRDVQMLESALRTIHWPTLDEHISELPHVMVNRIFHFWESFHATVTGTLFHLDDATLALGIRDLHQFWNQTVSYGFHYRNIPNGNYVFDNSDHRPFSPEQERDWLIIQNASIGLRDAKTKLLDHVRRDYIEVDIVALSEAAWIEYCDFINRPL